MPLNHNIINWPRIRFYLLSFVIVLILSLFVKNQMMGSRKAKLISSARQISFWIKDYTDSKMNKPRSLDELFDFASNTYGADSNKVISDFKVGKVIYNSDAQPGEEMIRWVVDKNLIILVTEEGRVWVNPSR